MLQALSLVLCCSGHLPDRCKCDKLVLLYKEFLMSRIN